MIIHIVVDFVFELKGILLVKSQKNQQKKDFLI